jgi:hypothetical protein
MKIKLWQLEYDFNKEDAEIVVPLILLLLGLVYTELKREVLWGGAVVFYLSYFFLKQFLLALKGSFDRCTTDWPSGAHTAEAAKSFCRDIRVTIPTNTMPTTSATDAARPRC